MTTHAALHTEARTAFDAWMKYVEEAGDIAEKILTKMSVALGLNGTDAKPFERIAVEPPHSGVGRALGRSWYEYGTGRYWFGFRLFFGQLFIEEKWGITRGEAGNWTLHRGEPDPDVTFTLADIDSIIPTLVEGLAKDARETIASYYAPCVPSQT